MSTTRKASVITRIYVVVALALCLPLMTFSIVRFMIDDHGAFFFGMKGFLDDDGELYAIAAPIWELGDQFPNWIFVLVTMSALTVALVTLDRGRMPLFWLLAALVTHAITGIGLVVNWNLNYAVLHQRWIECWGTKEQVLGPAAYALLLIPGLTLLAWHSRKSQVQ